MGRKPGAMFGDTHTIRLYLNEYRGELGVIYENLVEE